MKKRRLQREIHRDNPDQETEENASERVQLAAGAAAHQLVIGEDQRKRNKQVAVCLDQWRFVLCDDTYKVGMEAA